VRIKDPEEFADIHKLNVIIAATKRLYCVGSKFRHNVLAAGAPPDPKPNSWATSCKRKLKGDHVKKEQKGEGTQRGMAEQKREFCTKRRKSRPTEK